MSSDNQTLKRTLRFPFLLFYGVGTMVGGGFYALSGKVAGQVGMHAPLAFTLAGLLALVTALAFAEWSGRLPHAGGSARFVEHAFGSTVLSAAVGWMIIASGVVSAATLAVATTGFLQDLVRIPSIPTTAALVLLMGLVSAWGIAEAVAVITLITVVEVSALLYVVAAKGGVLLQLPAQASAIFLPSDLAAVTGILSAVFLAFYAFIGFEDMVTVAEEVKNARRALPAAVIWSLVITMLLYVLVSTVAVLAVVPTELAEARTPLARVVADQGGLATSSIVIVSMLTGINGALVQILMAARVGFGMAKRGYAPAWLQSVGRRTRTPVAATALATVAVLVLALSFELTVLAKITSAIILLVFALVNFGLWRIKGREQEPPAGVLAVPRVLPLLGALSSAGLLAFQLWRLVSA